MDSRGYLLDINQLIYEADRCVKCALCLPCCPTYQLWRDEADSPRGRIALIQALVQGELGSSSALQHHLDGCLMCRSCESACPSGVAFGRIMDAARERRWQVRGRLSRISSRLLLTLLSDRRAGVVIARLLHIYQRSGLTSLFRALLPARWRRLELMLPAISPIKPYHSSYPALSLQKRKVALFTGCVSQLVEQEVLHCAITLLSHLGCQVEVPASQCCCGAMHRHAGDSGAANRLLEQNRRHLSNESFDALLSIASGCGAELAEQGGFAQPVLEIGHYLAQLAWPEELKLRPLMARVAIHEPCSMRYGGFDLQAVARLLNKIPQLQQVTFADDKLCCGAAGSYMLTQPDNSQRLKKRGVEHAKKLQPDILVTSNTGCALQLRSGIREAGLNIEVLHPLQLIVRQLP